jgi:gamma-glutamyl-gamma-aminobutyrate hydrolase PuuD
VYPVKPVIGIVPTAHLFETDDFYKDNYIFVNNYAKRIAENGGVPMGLLADDAQAFPDALEICDAFVICGGARIFPYHFQTVEYAVKTGKRLLGICLGMQVIHSYFIVEDEAKKRGWTDSLTALYEQMKREKYMFTRPVEHHWDVHMTRTTIEETKHAVTVTPGTLLSRLTNASVIRASTMHHYRVDAPSPQLTVSGRTADGTIEALEYGDRILGVQFHPEVDKTFSSLFRFVVGQ